jgi:TolB protein
VQTRLVNNAASDTQPAWSPDDAKIALTSDRDSDTEIFLMNADGSGQTNHTNNATDERRSFREVLEP